ncbi:RVT-2 domain containing protein [Pyrenophora tritici-repentis]|nr:RVT-2 domain containing protein [Pyrenophora tritici-repentis]
MGGAETVSEAAEMVSEAAEMVSEAAEMVSETESDSTLTEAETPSNSPSEAQFESATTSSSSTESPRLLTPNPEDETELASSSPASGIVVTTTEPDHIVPAEVLSRHPNLRIAERATTRSGAVYGLVLAGLRAEVLTEATEPKSYQQAQETPEWEKWSAAVKEELASLEANHTWDLVEKTNQHSLGGKWVFKIKRGPHGEVLRHKARWVVRGFEQQEGIDYQETFAAVVKPMSYKAIFAIAAAKDLEIHQMDVKTAFLYGDIDNEICVEPPEGLRGSKGKLCRLRKALYGLKQSPRIWYQTLTEFMKSLYVAIYVDDLLLAGPNLDEIQTLKSSLAKRFEMSDLGECQFYLGMKITRDRASRTLWLSQQGYLRKVLEDSAWETARQSQRQSPEAGANTGRPSGIKTSHPGLRSGNRLPDVPNAWDTP